MKYLIFPSFAQEGSASADDLIAAYNVDPSECLIRDKATALESYPPELLVLCQMEPERYSLKSCPTVSVVAARLKERRAPRPGESPPQPLGARSAPKPRREGESTGSPA